MRTPNTPVYRVQHLLQPLTTENPTHDHPAAAVATSEALPVATTIMTSPQCPSHQTPTIIATEAPASSPPPTPHKPSTLYTCIPLPAQIHPEVSVIPFLQSGSGSGVDVDLGMSPRQLGLGGEGGATGMTTQLRRYLGAPATSPPLPSMTVVHPKLPWPITVWRSGMEYVTVWDVLVRTVESLRLPISMPTPLGADGDELRGYGRSGTRLDYLPGRRLVGLSKSELGEDVWVMDVV